MAGRRELVSGFGDALDSGKMDKEENMEEVTEETTIQSEDTPQRKIPLWQNPKIPIVVALVVVGLTILASGWLIWNKRKEKPIAPSTYFVCPDGSHHGPGVPSEGVQEWCKKHGYILPVEEVTITTDKTEYEQGEMVKITIFNNIDRSIFSYLSLNCLTDVSLEIERRTNSYWEKIFTFDEGSYTEIKPKNSYQCEWNQKFPEFGPGPKGGFGIKNVFVEPGIFRARFRYLLEQKDFSPYLPKAEDYDVSIYSNEFRIKEERGEIIEISGRIYSIGNDPFTQLAIETDDGIVYGLISKSKVAGLGDLGFKRLKVKGYLLGRTPPSFRTEKSIDVIGFEVIE